MKKQPQYVEILDRKLSTRQAAPFLGTTPQTLKVSRCTGTLFGVPAPSFVKIGRTVRYNQSTLQTWLKQFQEKASTSA